MTKAYAPRDRAPFSGCCLLTIVFGVLVGFVFRGANLELIARQTAIVCTTALA